MAQIVTVTIQLNDNNALATIKEIEAKIKELGATVVKPQVDATTIKAAATQTNELAKSFDRVTVSTKKSGDTITKLIGKVGLWAVATTAIYTPIRAFQDALKTLKEVDTELVTIQKVTGYSETQIKGLTDAAYDLAEAYGRTADEVLEASAAFARAGYADQIEQLTELSVLLQNVGDITSDNANSFLLATDAAWGLNGAYDALLEVINGMNEVTNQNATDFEKLAEGVTVAGSTFASTGESIQDFIALLGTGTAATQRSGSEVARALRTIAMNVRQIKGETEDGELIDGESISNAAKALKELGISTTDENGQLKKTTEVLDELAQKWDTLSSVSKSKITENLANKRQANVLSAIMDNWDKYSKMVAEYADSAGSALKENEIYLNSWEAKTKQLDASWTKFVASLHASDIIKTGITLVSKFVDVLSNGGAAMIALIAVMAGARTAYNAATTAILTNLEAQAINTITTEAASVSMWKKVLAADAATEAEFNALIVNKAFTAEEIKAAAAAGLLTTQNLRVAASCGTITVAEETALVGTKALNVSFKELWATMLASPMFKIVLIAAAITAVVEIAKALIVTTAELKEKADDLYDAADEAKQQADDIETKLEEIKQTMDEIADGGITLTEEEDYNRLKAETLELQQQKQLYIDIANAKNAKADKALADAFSGAWVKDSGEEMGFWDKAAAAMGAFMDNGEQYSDAVGDAVEKYKELDDLRASGVALTQKQQKELDAVTQKLRTMAQTLEEDYIDKITDPAIAAPMQALYDAIMATIYPAEKLGDTVNRFWKGTASAETAAEETADAWDDVEEAVDNAFKSLKFDIEDVENAIDALEKERDAKTAPYEDEIDALDRQIKSYEKIIKAYEKARDASLKPIEAEIDTLENQIDNLDDAINALKDAQDAALSPLDAQIDALKEAKDIEDERVTLAEKQLSVEQALQDLYDAQHTRNVRSYNAATGQWEWGANQKNVNDAQSSLADAQKDLSDQLRDMEISALERYRDEIEAEYQAQIDLLDDQKDILDKSKDAAEKQKSAIEDEYSALIDPLNDIIDNLNDEVDIRNDYIDAIELSYKDELDTLEARKQAMQDNYDLLQSNWERMQYSLEEKTADIADILDAIKNKDIQALRDLINAAASGTGETGTTNNSSSTQAPYEALTDADAYAHENASNATVPKHTKASSSSVNVYGSHISAAKAYDSGGILAGTGNIKATPQDETVLSPELTAKIVSPRANAAFTDFANALGVMFGVSSKMQGANATQNTYNNGGNTYINGVKIGSDMMNKPLSTVLATLCVRTESR